jgi:hypothetical protein
MQAEASSMSEQAPPPSWWRPYASDYPRWNAWKGSNGMLYASLPGSSPALVVRGIDPMDLRNEIIRTEADHRSWWEAR